MPRPTRKTRDESSDAGEVSGLRRGEKGARRGGKKKLITIEAGICMKTNKTTAICPGKKRHFCITERHFIQSHTFFSENDGLFVVFGAFGKEFRASKYRNSMVAVLFVSPGV